MVRKKVIEKEKGNPFGIVRIRIQILITFTSVVELEACTTCTTIVLDLESRVGIMRRGGGG